MNYNHSNNLSAQNLSVLSDALSGVALGLEPNAHQLAALRKLAVLYKRAPSMDTDALIRLWLDGPDASANVVSVSESDLLSVQTRVMEGMQSELNELKELVGKTVKTELTINIDGTVKNLGSGHRHPVFEDVLTSAALRENVYLVGPAGSGKTYIAEQVAKALDLPFYEYGAISMEHKFEGFIDAHGNYVETMLYKAFKDGGLVLFDEMDASNPNALLCLNAMLANDVASFPCGMVEKHPDFVVIATGNTVGHGANAQYVGRNPMDGATLDRYINIPMDYDQDLERALAGNDAWVDYVQAIRAAAIDHKMRYIVSQRASIKGAKLLAAGMSLEKVKAYVIFNKGFNETDIEKIESSEQVQSATRALAA
jgi:cobaltochelatase CobS